MTEADCRYRNERRVTVQEKEDWKVLISLCIFDETLEIKHENPYCHIACITAMFDGPWWTSIE
jgi:hypothetical protein